MKEFIETVNTYGATCFWIAVFALIGMGMVGSWLVRMTRSITGHYPPPDPGEDGDDEDNEHVIVVKSRV